MRYAVREFATVALSDEPARAEMQLNHLVSLIGERKLFMIVFELPENYETSDHVEPAENFVQTTGTQAGLTVELMRNGTLFTLGHPGDKGLLVPLARKDGTSVEVNQNEVLMPDEVGQLLVEYVRTSSIDTSGWALRETSLADHNHAVPAGWSLREQPGCADTAADEASKRHGNRSIGG
ncbi:hypothetical protein [Mycobacterium sp. SMC-17]|uniref:hypothetical protein n=1 Tax=Mycobacterium sp. SMC-17 TaxID=3381628 RepID=UPI003876991D